MSQKPENMNTFCTLPFIHICNRTDGKFLACCHAEGVVVDDSGKPFDISEGHTFEQVFNSKYMKSLRNSMLTGVRDDRCRLCWKLEDLGLSSKRMHDGNRFLPKTLDRLEKPELPFAPLSWDIKLGTLCNLKCRMCTPDTSTALMSEAIANKWQNEFSGKAYSKKTKDFLQYSHFKEELIRLLPHTEEIYFLGGEPTLIDSHIQILDHAINSGLAKNITVRWSTNLTHFDERYIERALHFKKIILDCSIEGYGAVNDYIRYPSKWEKIHSQIVKIKEHLPNALIKVVCTVQILNIFELEKIIQWSRSLKLSLGFNYLDTPQYLSAQNLPSNIKQMLIDKYSSSSEPQLQGLSKWLSTKGNSALMSEFFIETDRLDRVREQDFLSIVPEEFYSQMVDCKKIATNALNSPYQNGLSSK